jgi:sporulation protein YlmC with PRC-barrel domain
VASVIEDVKHGADVYTSDGAKVGTVYAIVLAPGLNEVTHIAVDTGPHFPEPGFGAPKVVSVEVDHLKSADGDRVDLDLAKDAFANLPPYEHTHFFQVPDSTPPSDEALGGRVWNAGIAIARAISTLGSGIAIPAEHFSAATFEHSILNDAPVWRVEPNTHIGNVESVLVDDASDELTGLVIHRGVLFPVEVVLPMKYVTEIRDGVIHAQLSDEDIHGLQKHEG